MQASATVGTLTIGQSPRPDVLADLEPMLPAVRWVHAGALDGLSRAEIGALAPGPGDAVLVSRLQDGAEVRLAERLVLPLLEAAIRKLDDQVDLWLVLCTAELVGLDATRPLVFPGRILRHLAGALAPRRLGVLTPAREQIGVQRARWAEVAPAVAVEAASPYSEPGGLDAAGRRLAAAPVDLVVLDCIGYTRSMRERLRALLGVPLLGATTVLGRVAAELLGS